MTRAVALVTVMCLAPLLLADHRQVVSDDKVDCSSLKTFSIREGAAKTTRPELSNKLILEKVEDAIRAQLSAKRLTESLTRPDVMVSFTIGQDRPDGPSDGFPTTRRHSLWSIHRRRTEKGPFDA